jgi:hypothetical protein
LNCHSSSRLFITTRRCYLQFFLPIDSAWQMTTINVTLETLY